MSSSRFHTVAVALTGAILAASGSSAFAAWTFGGTSNVSTDGAVKATATAFSVQNETATSTTAGVTTLAGEFKNTTKFVSSSISYNVPNGVGVYAPGETSSANYDHAVDNTGYTDMVLFSFTYAASGAAAVVDLNNFQMGWATADSDVSLLYYSGTKAPAAIDGQSWSELTAAGWKLVKDYADVGTASQTVTGDKLSSWWLISAYNTGFGGTAPAAGNTLTRGGDYFKIASLTGAVITSSQVPEPGSLALVGLAFAGLVGARRRASRKN